MASCSLPPLCLQDRVTVGKMEREPEALQAATAAREAELLARQRAAAAAEQRRRRERRAARWFSAAAQLPALLLPSLLVSPAPGPALWLAQRLPIRTCRHHACLRRCFLLPGCRWGTGGGHR